MSNYSIISSSPSEVMVHDFPDNTKHVFYENDNRLLRLNFYARNAETHKNFFNPEGVPSASSYDNVDTLKFDYILAFYYSINSHDPSKNLTPGAHPTVWGYKFSDEVFDNKVKLSNRYPISNTSSGMICWGRFDDDYKKMTPKGVIDSLTRTKFNNDYCSLEGFYSGVMNAKVGTEYVRPEFTYYDHSAKTWLCSDYDAIMLLDSKNHPISFFKMLCAGFNTLEECDTTMIIPLIKSTIENDGNEHDGYITPKDVNCKHWFITKSGKLIGQLDSN
jgi:hypothetical protein